MKANILSAGLLLTVIFAATLSCKKDSTPSVHEKNLKLIMNKYSH